jgi:tRNA A-37 threonylcarbamoyl transferase component Bud32
VELEALMASMSESGPFLAYTHGDPCPDNCLLSDSRVCLVDFEVAGFRHVLIDGVYGRIHFPTGWCVNRIEQRIVQQMELAYRAELVKGCPEAADDVQFYHAIVAEPGTG